MKIKHVYLPCLFWGLMIASVVSCKKKDPSIDDFFLNYTIPEVPPTADYLTGSFYYTFATFNPNIKQIPTIGVYTTPSTGVVPPTVMQAQIGEANVAKLDYFIFQLRSPTLANANYKIDSTTVNSFLSAPNSSSMNFAVSYNMDITLLGITTSGNLDPNGNPRGIPLEANATKLAAFYNDFVRLSFWFKKANYQKVNGKWLILINHAQDLNSNMDPANPGSDAPLYTELRKRLSALGFDLYIVGEQDNWTAPNNYFFRYQNCVDAVYEANMADGKTILDHNYLFAQECDQNFAYWKKELESWPAGGLTPGAKNLEFVPCIQAAYNYQINSPTSTNLSIIRDSNGDFYRTYTNIAKRNASSSRLIFIDSFNNYLFDTQIEPTQSYGTLFLDITRQEFKVTK